MTWESIQYFFNEERKRLFPLIDEKLTDNCLREQHMDQVRLFKSAEETLLLARQKNNEISLEKLWAGLTALGDVCLQRAYDFEKASLVDYHGPVDSEFYLIAMGKFGALEMNPGSDLDLIFLFEEQGVTSGEHPISYQEFFVRLIQRLISHLSVATGQGKAYEIDTELRPSGRSGILVTSWESFKDYHISKAQLWEKQSLLKARPVGEPKATEQKLLSYLRESIWNADFSEQQKNEFHRIRLRIEQELAREDGQSYHIKLGKGGLIDIEFAVQYLQLQYGRDDFSLCLPHTLSALDALQSCGHLTSETVSLLKEAYLFYRHIEMVLRQLKQRSYGRLSLKKKDEGNEIAQRAGYDSFDSLKKKYEDYREKVRGTYLAVLGIV